MTGLLIGAAVYIVALGKWPAAICVAVLAIAARDWLGRRAWVVIVSAVVAAWWIGAALPPAAPAAIDGAQPWRLEVTSMPQLREQGWSFTGRVLDGEAEGHALLVYTTGTEPIAIGDRVYLYGTVRRREEIAASYGSYLDGRGVSGDLYTGPVSIDRQGSGPAAWFNRLRNETVARVIAAAPGDAGALLAGFVTGDDGQLSSQSDDRFRAAGLSHLTAVSGANLAMLVTMVAAAGRASGRRRTTVLLLGAVAAWGYAIFVGLPPPTLRAALLTTAVAGGRLAGRPVDLLSLAFLTIVAQVAVRPIDAYSVSFHLSTAASLGLAAGLNSYPAIDRRPGLADLVEATLFAQLATMPVILGAFGETPTLGVLANVVAVPIATFAFTVAVGGALLLWLSESLGEALLIPAAWAAERVLDIADLYGRSWSVVETGEIGTFWVALLLIAVLLGLMQIGGDLPLLTRQLRKDREKRRNSG